MANPATRTTESPFDDILSRRIMVLDGAMGSLIFARQPTEEDYRGARFARHSHDLKNCTEILVLTQPSMIEGFHTAYLEAGADIIETDSFNSNALSLAEFGLEEHVFELNRTAAEIARRAADAMTRRTPDRPRFVAGSIGPTKKSLSMGVNVEDPGHRDVTFDEMVANYSEQIRGLVAGGVDLLLPETSFDTLVLKACLFSIDKFFEETGTRLPVMISGTIFENGRTLSAQSVEAFYYSISHFDAMSVGLNCALGVDQMRGPLESLAGVARTRVSCYPNAGMPDGFGGFQGDLDHTAASLGEFARNGWLNLVGGCCGTTPEWIHAIARAVEGVAPRQIPDIPAWSTYSGSEPLVVRPETNFVMVGERTNITGSKRFARLIKGGDYEGALAVAREQVEGGANIIDINMDEGMIDGEAAMTKFLNLVSAEPDITKVPIMVDSSKWSIIEAGLKCVQGKSIVNSISLKEGEEKFLEQARLVKRYGAAVVVMAFDEEGQAVTADRKVAICERAHRLLTEEVGFASSDIIFDVNILTVGTGIEEHNNYAVEFIEAVRQLKQKFPEAKTSGGVSNVSFSYRGNDTVREAMNAAFLYHAIRAGLDMGIVNAGQLEVYEQIPADLLEHVEDVLLNRRPDAADRLTDFAESVKRRGKKESGKDMSWREESVEERLKHALDHGHDRLHRRRPGRGPQVVPADPLDHRRPADGRHERRRRPLRLGQDVPAAGRQERPGDEEGRRLSAPLHGRREGAARRGRTAGARQGPDGDGEGGRARHRQEHRRRGPRLQRLRDHRPRRHGPVRDDPDEGPRGEGRHDRALRPDHPLARRDGPRRQGDGAAGLPDPAPDRRRHDQRQAHGGQDRAELSRAGGPRPRRLAERGRGRPAQPPRAEGGARPREPGRPGARSAEPLAPDTSGPSSPTPRPSGAGSPSTGRTPAPTRPPSSARACSAISRSTRSSPTSTGPPSSWPGS